MPDLKRMVLLAIPISIPILLSLVSRWVPSTLNSYYVRQSLAQTYVVQMNMGVNVCLGLRIRDRGCMIRDWNWLYGSEPSKPYVR